MALLPFCDCLLGAGRGKMPIQIAKDKSGLRRSARYTEALVLPALMRRFRIEIVKNT
jgi:hypothetical protein